MGGSNGIAPLEMALRAMISALISKKNATEQRPGHFYSNEVFF